MPTMKVTPDAAMRARDVSRPHAEDLGWAEEAEASVTAAVVEADVVVKSGVAAEVGHWPAGTPAKAERLAMAAAPAEVDIPDPEYPGSEDRAADADRGADADRAADADRVADGTRRRRVRSFRSSSRRGRPSR